MDDSMHLLKEHRKARLAAVFVTIALVTLLHYGTMGSHVAYHTLYRELYFIPIILMSFWYGLRKGCYTAVLVIFLYLPHVFMTWQEQPGVNVGNLLQVLVFLLVAVATGVLSDRERERHRIAIQAQNLATLGRTTLAMNSELQEVLKILKSLQPSTLVGADPSIGETMGSAIQKISTLHDLLSHFSQGGEHRPRGFAEIASAIERAREAAEKLAKQGGIAVETGLKAVSGTLRMNAEDLSWIIEELIKNAIAHSDSGGSVTVNARRFEDRVEIAVTDQGHGIRPENLSMIFVPFYTTKEDGTGLGLPVCRKMMRDLGGDILVESQLGQGSRFTLVFPAALA